MNALMTSMPPMYSTMALFMAWVVLTDPSYCAAVVFHDRHHEGHAHRDGAPGSAGPSASPVRTGRSGCIPDPAHWLSSPASRCARGRSMLSTWSTMTCFIWPLEVSRMVPRGIFGSFSRSLSRMDFRIEKVALWEIERAREYRDGPQQKPHQSHGAPGQVEREFLVSGQAGRG